LAQNGNQPYVAIWGANSSEQVDLSALLPTCLAKVNACFGSQVRIQNSSESGLEYGDEPTLMAMRTLALAERPPSNVRLP
jgi:hypothetical protein